MTACHAATSELLISWTHRGMVSFLICSEWSQNVDFVQAERLLYCFCFRNELQPKSKCAAVILYSLCQLHVRVIYSYLTKNSEIVGLLFCKI